LLKHRPRPCLQLRLEASSSGAVKGAVKAAAVKAVAGVAGKAVARVVGDSAEIAVSASRMKAAWNRRW
jgi:hypothetical protein